MSVNSKMSNLEGYTRSGDYIRTVSLIGPDGTTASILTLGGRLLDLRLPSGLSVALPLPTIRDVEDDGAYATLSPHNFAHCLRFMLSVFSSKYCFLFGMSQS